MANFSFGFFDATSNLSNKSVDADVFFTTVTSPTDNLNPFYKTLAVLRVSVGCVLNLMMFLSNAATLHAVWSTPQLLVKAYALTTSMTASNLLLSIVLWHFFAYEIFGMTPCSLQLYKAAVRPVERWIIYVSFVHVSAIACDRYIAVMYPLHYENRVTPTVIRNIIIAVWVTAGVLSLPAYLGFIWPDPATCIATLWPMFETVVEISLYLVSSSLVIVVYIRIWKTVMRIELQQQQQSGRENAEHSVRTLWQQRQLIPKHRATRTTMVILVSFVCLYFPYILTRLLGLMRMPFAELMSLVTSWIGMMAFASHAFIYAIVNHEFRRAFRRNLLYLIRRRGADGNRVIPVGSASP